MYTRLIVIIIIILTCIESLSGQSNQSVDSLLQRVGKFPIEGQTVFRAFEVSLDNPNEIYKPGLNKLSLQITSNIKCNCVTISVSELNNINLPDYTKSYKKINTNDIFFISIDMILQDSLTSGFTLLMNCGNWRYKKRYEFLKLDEGIVLATEENRNTFNEEQMSCRPITKNDLRWLAEKLFTNDGFRLERNASIDISDTANFYDDFETAVEERDLRFIGLYGFTIEVPNVPDYYQNYYGILGLKIIGGSLDTYWNHNELERHIRYQSYAENYNNLLLKYLSQDASIIREN